MNTMYGKNMNKSNRINLSTIITITLMLIFTILLFVFSDFCRLLFPCLLGEITKKFGWLYILLFFISLVFFGWIVFGKYGKIKLGGEQEIPQYKEFEWASMILCTGMAGSIMIFSFVDPIYYITDPPFGIEKMSMDAYEYAHMYSQFHWGVVFWPLCIPVTIMMGMCMHTKGQKGSLGENLSANGYGNKLTAGLIDVLSGFSTLGGMGTSMGLTAPLVCILISDTFGLKNNGVIHNIVFGAWFFLFTFSVIKGLDRGIKRLSTFNILIAFFFIGIVLLSSSIVGTIELEMNSVGIFLDSIFRISLYTDPFKQSEFPQRWTVFYIAFTLVYVPLIGSFTAKISKGRTLRQIAIGMMLYGVLAVVISFSICGYYSLNIQKIGQIDLSKTLSLSGKEWVIVEILNTFRFKKALKILFACICFVFMATTMDSTVYVLSTDTSNCSNIAKSRKILWAVIVFAFSFALSKIGGMDTMQLISVMAAFPMIIILVVVMYAVKKMLEEKQQMEEQNG